MYSGLYKDVKSLECITVIFLLLFFFKKALFSTFVPWHLGGKRKSFVRELWVGGLPLGFPITLQGTEVYRWAADFRSGVSWLKNTQVTGVHHSEL